MDYVFAMITAMAVCLAAIPLLVRAAPQLGMMDLPDPRKIHTAPVPRMGGWGIVLGTLFPVAVLAPVNEISLSYFFGALVLLFFGSWDDRREIDHYTKFAGQFIAVLPVVAYGGLYVENLPIIGEIPSFIAIPFTIIALIGMINAMNHSDGLDGLAGGEAIVSLAAFAVLAFPAGGDLALIIAFAAIGGTFGFLRYNTHPAVVFMGDGGSQFLGFTLGFLAVLLTQEVDTTLTGAVVALILGLPIADILVVLIRRMSQGRNWFLATKDHIHHRLLNLGLMHHQSVAVIYVVHATLVVGGIYLRYASAWLIIGLYLIVCGLLFFLLNQAEEARWTAPRAREEPYVSDSDDFSKRRHKWLVIAPRRFLDVAVPLYLILGCIYVAQVPRDFGFVSAVVFLLILLESLISEKLRSIIYRGLIYATAVFAVYLQFRYPSELLEWLEPLELTFFTLLALVIIIAIRYCPRQREYEFTATAMDYLMIFFAPLLLVSSYMELRTLQISILIIEVVIILYACELLIVEKRNRWTPLTISSLIAAGILAGKGLL